MLLTSWTSNGIIILLGEKENHEDAKEIHLWSHASYQKWRFILLTPNQAVH